MPINTGRGPIPPDDTTMIIYRNRTPVDPQRKRDLARRCGVECIRLMYKGNLATTVGTSGFQHVTLMTQPRKGGGTEPAARWHKNEFTNESMAEGSMDFVPDEMGTGWAWLPDSPFNRVRLAYAEIKKNALWEIYDKAVLMEIQELAVEIRKSVEYREEMEAEERARTEVNVRVQERGIQSGTEQKTRIEIENKVLADKIKELEQEQLREELKKRLAKLQAGLPEVVAVPPQVEPVTGDLQFDFSEAQEPAEGQPSKNDSPVIGIRKQATAYVYDKNSELVDSVKEAHAKNTGNLKGWAWSKDYREKIEPLIKARIKEIWDVEHSTTGNDT